MPGLSSHNHWSWGGSAAAAATWLLGTRPGFSPHNLGERLSNTKWSALKSYAHHYTKENHGDNSYTMSQPVSAWCFVWFCFLRCGLTVEAQNWMRDDYDLEFPINLLQNYENWYYKWVPPQQAQCHMLSRYSAIGEHLHNSPQCHKFISYNAHLFNSLRKTNRLLFYLL